MGGTVYSVGTLDGGMSHVLGGNSGTARERMTLQYKVDEVLISGIFRRP